MTALHEKTACIESPSLADIRGILGRRVTLSSSQLATTLHVQGRLVQGVDPVPTFYLTRGKFNQETLAVLHRDQIERIDADAHGNTWLWVR